MTIHLSEIRHMLKRKTDAPKRQECDYHQTHDEAVSKQHGICYGVANLTTKDSVKE